MKYIHSKSNVEGDVELGDGVSVWPFASIRGDEGTIKIGNNTSIQDNVTVHGNVLIGNNVTVGHNAIIHGAKIGNNVLIGMNSTIMDNVEVADWSIIAAGTVIPPNKKIESESLVMGVPGKVVRKLESKDKDFIISSYKNYLEHIKQKQK